MRKLLLYVICFCLVAISCERRELTYNYSPYCEVVINVDWENMSKTPNGMTVICYPESGAAPITKVNGDNVKQETLLLPAGVYNIVVFNRQVSDFDYVGFRGMDKFETAEVHSLSTTSKWAVSKAESELVTEPDEVGVATYLDVEIKQECIEKSTELYKKEGKHIVAHTLDLTPVVVVKKTRVNVRVKGIHNLRSTRATLFGMSEGYNFSTQMSVPINVTHVLEQWKIEEYEYGEEYGGTNTEFISFGVPNYATPTRAGANGDWNGSIDLSMLLVDNKTVMNFKNIPLKDKLTYEEETGKLTTTIRIDVGYDDTVPDLPDVKPEGGTESGLDADIDSWGDEDVTTVPIG